MIWQSLKKPILILAPMEDVTDTVFRRVIHSIGSPDLFFTEFTNVEGLASAKGNPIVSQRLLFTPVEHPIIAQIWGKSPEHYRMAAIKIRDMGFDGIDINMGCPEKSVIKNGCCAALINNQSLAREIIAATKEGAKNLPVSVKTRIGFQTIITEEWISFLLSQHLAAITIHGRTAKEMSEVSAHWDEIGKAVTLRDALNKQTFIIGNGDVVSKQQALEKVAQYNVDGVMIGRGIFHNPFLFSGKNNIDIQPKELFAVMKRHLVLYQETWGSNKQYQILKKYFKIYVQGFDGAAEIRAKLMETHTTQEALDILETIASEQL